MPDTIECPACDAKIAKSETKCPACGCNIEELEDNLKQLDTLEKVRAKRRATSTPTTTVTVVVKRKSLFGGLIK